MNDPVMAVMRRLTASGNALQALVKKVDEDEVRWKPEASSWSILEVVNHLADEEVEDFRTRLDILLHRPEDPFPPIDPKGWVTRRDYKSRDPAQSLSRFMSEREASLRWLLSLKDPQLDRQKVHLSGARFTARQLMAAWAAHDLLHVRQITRLRYQYLGKEVAPVTLDYAGNW